MLFSANKNPQLAAKIFPLSSLHYKIVCGKNHESLIRSTHNRGFAWVNTYISAQIWRRIYFTKKHFNMRWKEYKYFIRAWITAICGFSSLISSIWLYLCFNSAGLKGWFNLKSARVCVWRIYCFFFNMASKIEWKLNVGTEERFSASPSDLYPKINICEREKKAC